MASSASTETAAALLCAGLLAVALARAGLVAAVAVAARACLAGRRVAGALQPRFVRRCVTALAGLAAPLAAQVSAATAAPAPAPVHAVVEPARLERWTPAHPTSTGTSGYVVVRGDTLWDIARRHLSGPATDAEIAQAWPRWYSANRTVIGPDPGRLVPGTRLRVPGSRATGTSSAAHPPTAATLAATSLDPDRR